MIRLNSEADSKVWMKEDYKHLPRMRLRYVCRFIHSEMVIISEFFSVVALSAFRADEKQCPVFT